MKPLFKKGTARRHPSALTTPTTPGLRTTARTAMSCAMYSTNSFHHCNLALLAQVPGGDPMTTCLPDSRTFELDFSTVCDNFRALDSRSFPLYPTFYTQFFRYRKAVAFAVPCLPTRGCDGKYARYFQDLVNPSAALGASCQWIDVEMLVIGCAPCL
jgi:hypothetical protein